MLVVQLSSCCQSLDYTKRVTCKLNRFRISIKRTFWLVNQFDSIVKKIKNNSLFISSLSTFCLRLHEKCK